MTEPLRPPVRFDDVTARTFVAAVAALLESAGLVPYVGPGYSDSILRGLEKRAGNIQPWSVHDPDAGSPVSFAITKPGPGEAAIGVEIWGMKGANRLYHPVPEDAEREDERFWIDDRAVRVMAGRIGQVLRAAGLDVLDVEHNGNDAGWGTYNVGFEIRFRKAPRA